MRLLPAVLLLLLLSIGPVRAGPDLQAMFDAASRLEEAGDWSRAAEGFYAVLEALRADGRGETADAGLAAAGVARALDAAGDAQADDAFRLALALLPQAADPVPFLATSQQFVERLLRAGRAADAVPVAEAALARTGGAGVEPAYRMAAIEMAIAAYGRADRQADVDRVLMLAEGLSAAGPDAAHLSGLARLSRARDAEAAGRRAEAVEALEGSIADLRAAGEAGADLLGTVLLLRGRIAFSEGDYRRALERLDAAVPALSRPDADPAERAEAIGLRLRLLLRFERIGEALAAADAAIEELASGDPSAALGLRLDRVEILLAAGRRADASAELDAIAAHLGGRADPLLAAFYYERLAAVRRDEERFDEAMAAADEAIRIRRQTGQPDASVLEAMRIRADASTASPDIDMSERTHRDLVELSRSVFPPTHPELARDLNALATFLTSQREFTEAARILRSVAEILKAAYGPESPKYAYALANLGIARMFDGGAEEAVGLFERAIAITDPLPETGDFPGVTRINLASALDELKRYADMLAQVEAASSRADLSPRHRMVLEGLRMRALQGLGRLDEAMAAGRRMQALAPTSVATYEDAQNHLVGIVRFAGVALAAGRPAEGLDLAREAIRRTEQLKLGGGAAWRDAAAALVGSAWAVAGGR